MLRKLPKMLAELIQLGTVMAAAYLSFDEPEDPKNTDNFTYELVSIVLASFYIVSKHLEKLGIANEAQARDDARHPIDKPDKSSSWLIRHQDNINNAGTFFNMAVLIGLIAGHGDVQKASAILGPLSAEIFMALTNLAAKALENVGRMTPPDYQPLAQLPSEAQPDKKDETLAAGKSTDGCNISGIFTLRNSGTLTFIIGIEILSYMSIEKNDKSDKFFSYTLLAKIMNGGLALSGALEVAGTMQNANAYDNKKNPVIKSEVTTKQEITKWMTALATAASAVANVGLFANKPLNTISVIANPIAVGAQKIMANLYADEVVKNADAPRRKM